MVRLMTWLRQMGGVVCACLMLAMVVAPNVDAAICAAEPSMTMADQHGPAHITADDVAQDRDQSDGGEVCVHGHCHHGSPAIGLETMPVTAPAMVAGRLAPHSPGIPSSSWLDSIKEPPRA